MDSIVLFKLESLHARTVGDKGLTIRQRGHEISTGTIVAHLDHAAESLTNIALVDVATGAITLKWTVIAAMPTLADAFAAGSLTQKERSPVRVTLEESGHVFENGSGFAVKGAAQIHPGSFLSGARIDLHNNQMQITADGPKAPTGSLLASGSVVRCTLVPESSYVDITLSKSMGGGSHRLNLIGGFLLVPVMTLARSEQPKRGRRKEK